MPTTQGPPPSASSLNGWPDELATSSSTRLLTRSTSAGASPVSCPRSSSRARRLAVFDPLRTGIIETATHGWPAKHWVEVVCLPAAAPRVSRLTWRTGLAALEAVLWPPRAEQACNDTPAMQAYVPDWLMCTCA